MTEKVDNKLREGSSAGNIVDRELLIEIDTMAKDIANAKTEEAKMKARSRMYNRLKTVEKQKEEIAKKIKENKEKAKRRSSLMGKPPKAKTPPKPDDRQVRSRLSSPNKQYAQKNTKKKGVSQKHKPYTRKKIMGRTQIELATGGKVYSNIQSRKVRT
tara:strand:+ start:287 stop:760 length:474 start_codon:yes stop_codon:yes gene_type:complete